MIKVSFRVCRTGAVIIVLLIGCGPVRAELRFQDVSTSAGFAYQGESFGSAWGSYNRDACPDVFINLHRQEPARIYRNNCDGTFADVTADIDTSGTLLGPDDPHAGTWGDYDNDGDQDLLITAGTNYKGFTVRLYENDEGLLIDRTELLTPVESNQVNEGRMAPWVDVDNDGQLDFFAMHLGASRSRLFMQREGTFVDSTSESEFLCAVNNYGQLADLSGDGRMEFVCGKHDSNVNWFPDAVYDIDPWPLGKVKDLLPVIPVAADSAIGDFNNDLRSDVFVLTGNLRKSSVLQVDENLLEVTLRAAQSEKGASFNAASEISLDIYTSGRKLIPQEGVLIGSAGWHPSNWSWRDGRIGRITLNANDPSSAGIFEHVSGVDIGLYIGYEPSAGRWQILLSNVNDAFLVIESSSVISDVAPIGFTESDYPTRPVYLMNEEGGFVDKAQPSGLGANLSCQSAVPGDFDNDGDLDLFLVCTDDGRNLNRLYENVGAGEFTLHEGAVGATGPDGIGLISGAGIGESATTADFDGDGFLDLLVTNGLRFNPLATGGPIKLYRNVGNQNRWIAFDLVGTSSNRDGIGARVHLTGGDQRRQLREQNGGYRRHTQDHKRVHFGLGGESQADVEVLWPSGVVDRYASLDAGLVHTLVEGRSAWKKAICEVPALDPAVDTGMFLWIEGCGTSRRILNVRTIAPASPETIRYAGRIVSSGAISGWEPLGLEPTDEVDWTDSETEVAFETWLSSGDSDGFRASVGRNANVCFVSADGPVYVGSDKVPAPATFDLDSLGPCSWIPELLVRDVTLDEGKGLASFAIGLSIPSDREVSVSFATENLTAEAGLDYVGLAGTLVFPAGSSEGRIDVPVVADSLREGSEAFKLVLTKPTNAVIATPGFATATIEEPAVASVECGAPTIDPSSEAGLFLSRDCDTGLWRVRVSGNGLKSGLFYKGAVATSAPFASVNGEDLEASDRLDLTDPLRLQFALGIGLKGFDDVLFGLAYGARTCFSLEKPADASVFVGPQKTPLLPGFDVDTLDACGQLARIIVDPIEVSEGAGVARLVARLSHPGPDEVSFHYWTHDGTAVDGLDYGSVSGTLTFAPGETVQSVDVPLFTDALPEDSEGFSILFSDPRNATVPVALGSARIIDDLDPSLACGKPSLAKATDRGVFVWQNCEKGNWFVRVAAGGSTKAVTYEGVVVSSNGFESVSGQSLEDSDRVEDQANPGTLAYRLSVKRAEVDGFAFAPLPDSETCFGLTMPADASVYIGERKARAVPALNLGTLGPCTKTRDRTE